MALEDALCLAGQVDAFDDIETAFAAYQEARFQRTARVQVMSRMIGDYIYHPSGGMAAPAQCRHERQIT